MSRICLTAAVVCCSAALAALAAPGPKADPVTYHPAKVGDTRVYELHQNGKVDYIETDAVTKVTKTDRDVEVTVDRTMSTGRKDQFTYALSETGVHLAGLDGGRSDKRFPLLKLPAQVGTTWETDGIGGMDVYKVVRVDEEVEVPAGKFKAVVVECRTRGEISKTQWFARGVGLVKTTYTRPGHERVLVKHTPAK